MEEAVWQRYLMAFHWSNRFVCQEVQGKANWQRTDAAIPQSMGGQQFSDESLRRAGFYFKQQSANGRFGLPELRSSLQRPERKIL